MYHIQFNDTDSQKMKFTTTSTTTISSQTRGNCHPHFVNEQGGQWKFMTVGYYCGPINIYKQSDNQLIYLPKCLRKNIFFTQIIISK